MSIAHEKPAEQEETVPPQSSAAKVDEITQ